MNQNKRIIGVCALLAVAVGSLNSIFRNKRLPSTRFLIGSGVAFLILSAMAETETGGELAKGLATGVLTTVILGEGGGLLTYLDQRGETDTRRRPSPNPADPVPPRVVPNQVPNRPDSVTIPGMRTGPARPTYSH